MRARRIKREYDAGGNVLRRDLVFFGSYGRNSDGSAKFYNPDNKHDNFSDGKQGIADSLLFKLNILEGELWNNITYGWPIWDKNKSKYVFDIFLSSTILKHPEVLRIEEFNSWLEYNEEFNHNEYKAKILIVSNVGEIEFNISQQV